MGASIAEDFARKHDVLVANALDCRDGRPHLNPALYEVVFERDTRLRVCKTHAKRLAAAIKAHGSTNAAGQTITEIRQRTADSISSDREVKK